MRTILLSTIRLYQKLLSPDHSFWARFVFPSGYCKFSPTCSEYSYQVINKKGALKGSPKAVWRILRCNPWTRGGVDAPQ